MAATVPLVLLPRYTTLSGASTFTTSPVRIDGYEEAQLFVWRGKMAATGTFSFRFQESTDQQNWIDLISGDPGSEAEATYTGYLTRLWVRAKVVVGGDPAVFPVVSCYAVGFLVKRR
jgi:hypothetical protein